MSFELGHKSWKVTASYGRRGPSRYNVDAGDVAAVARCNGKAREGCKLEPQAKVHSCYEAGRDGWWLHRWLSEQGVDNTGCVAWPTRTTPAASVLRDSSVLPKRPSSAACRYRGSP